MIAERDLEAFLAACNPNATVAEETVQQIINRGTIPALEDRPRERIKPGPRSNK